MKQISKQLKYFLDIASVHGKLVRSFDSGLGQGIGFNDFLVLYYLSQEAEQKMRRVDLAEKLSVTASGITRMLLPMEKIGLVKREESDSDGRVVYVKLAPGGKRILEDVIEKAEMKAEELSPFSACLKK